MLERKWLGDKTKGGFYKKAKGATERRGTARRSIGRRWNIIRARKRNSLPLIWRKTWRIRARACACCLDSRAARRKATKPGQFLWSALSDLWTYSANRIPEISDTIVEIDRAMRLGFNWELGPFELWDAAGVEATVARMKKEGHPVAANVEKLLASWQEILVSGRSQGCLRPGLF